MSGAPVSNLASRRLIRGAGHSAAAAAGAAEAPACREQASEARGRQQVRYRELMGEKQVLSAHHSFPNSHHPIPETSQKMWNCCDASAYIISRRPTIVDLSHLTPHMSIGASDVPLSSVVCATILPLKYWHSRQCGKRLFVDNTIILFSRSKHQGLLP